MPSGNDASNPSGGSYRKATLADSAGAGECYEPARVRRQQLDDSLQLGLAPDESVQWRGRAQELGGGRVWRDVQRNSAPLCPLIESFSQKRREVGGEQGPQLLSDLKCHVGRSIIVADPVQQRYRRSCRCSLRLT